MKCFNAQFLCYPCETQPTVGTGRTDPTEIRCMIPVPTDRCRVLWLAFWVVFPVFHFVFSMPLPHLLFPPLAEPSLQMRLLFFKPFALPGCSASHQCPQGYRGITSTTGKKTKREAQPESETDTSDKQGITSNKQIYFSSQHAHPQRKLPLCCSVRSCCCICSPMHREPRAQLPIRLPGHQGSPTPKTPAGTQLQQPNKQQKRQKTCLGCLKQDCISRFCQQSKQPLSSYPCLQAPKLPKPLIFHLEHLLSHRDKDKRSCRAGGSRDHPMLRKHSSSILIQQGKTLNPAHCGNKCPNHHPFPHKP